MTHENSPQLSPAVSRRSVLTAGAILMATGVVMTTEQKAEAKPSQGSWKDFSYCLNTSTIREQNIGIVQEVELAAKLGYDGIEPWIRQLDQFEKEGGSLKDLGKRIADLGLKVESAIGFARWIVDDEQERSEGLETLKRDMDKLRQIGGERIAAPPTGATKEPGLDLFAAAERYHAILELGTEMGVIPQVEVWGHSQNLHRVGEAAFVAIESGHPEACLLPDVFHIYKGGSDFHSLELISGNAIHCFHVNDYPDTPERTVIRDNGRVYPGDGVAPLDYIFQTLHKNGFRGALSLELFNPTYWKQDAEQVARTGLEKTQAAVQKALES